MNAPATGPYRDNPNGEPRPSSKASDVDQKIALYTRIGLPVGTVVGAAIAGSVQGPPAAVLVLAGGALVGVIALFWASVRTLIGETPLSGADAYALGAPRAEEEQKRAVLRALKDLEDDRRIGKISDEDYQALTLKYRAEAKRLLRLLDEEAAPRRAQVEAIVAKRLRREGLTDTGYREAASGEATPRLEIDAAEKTSDEAPKAETAKPAKSKKKKARDTAPAAKSDDAKSEKAAKSEPEAKASEGATRTCASCGTKNDPDAVFCKKCGARQVPDDAPMDDDDDAADAKTEEEAS